MYNFAEDIPKHSGYHYCSTAIEWYFLIDAIKESKGGKPFVPKVSLDDGIKAVEMGIASLKNVSNGGEAGKEVTSVTAHSTKSSDNLLDFILNAEQQHYGNVQQ